MSQVPPDLTPVLVTGRAEAVLEQLTEAAADAMLVTSLTNIRWLTGFTGSNGALVIGPGRSVLVTDARYASQAASQLESAGSETEVIVAPDLVPAALGELRPGWVVALEDSVTWRTQRRLAEAHDGGLVATSELIENLRASKSGPELERMQVAAAIVDDTLAEVVPSLMAGRREREVALAIDDGMRARGASGPAYETIVASGPNAALPHARPTDRALTDGDTVIIDAGAVVDGYRSDMTRTFVVGRADARVLEMLEVVTESQACGVAGVGPDVEAGTIDALCRDVIEAARMGEAFLHGTGHGVGLDIHELPRVRRGSTAILRPGHVLTVEPGVYFPDVGGVRVEDTVVVTEDGCRSLTRFPKNHQIG